MKRISLFVDDDTTVVSVTTLADKDTYHNVQTMAFDVRNTDTIAMPESNTTTEG